MQLADNRLLDATWRPGSLVWEASWHSKYKLVEPLKNYEKLYIWLTGPDWLSDPLNASKCTRAQLKKWLTNWLAD